MTCHTQITHCDQLSGYLTMSKLKSLWLQYMCEVIWWRADSFMDRVITLRVVKCFLSSFLIFSFTFNLPSSGHGTCLVLCSSLCLFFFFFAFSFVDFVPNFMSSLLLWGLLFPPPLSFIAFVHFSYLPSFLPSFVPSRLFRRMQIQKRCCSVFWGEKVFYSNLFYLFSSKYNC